LIDNEYQDKGINDVVDDVEEANFFCSGIIVNVKT